MPIIKSAIKRNRQNAVRNERNRSFRSSMRTSIKAVENFIDNKNKKEAELELRTCFKKIDKAVSKGLMKKNTVSRIKSRLTLAINKID